MKRFFRQIAPQRRTLWTEQLNLCLRVPALILFSSLYGLLRPGQLQTLYASFGNCWTWRPLPINLLPLFIEYVMIVDSLRQIFFLRCSNQSTCYEQDVGEPGVRPHPLRCSNPRDSILRFLRRAEAFPPRSHRSFPEGTHFLRELSSWPGFLRQVSTRLFSFTTP